MEAFPNYDNSGGPRKGEGGTISLLDSFLFLRDARCPWAESEDIGARGFGVLNLSFSSDHHLPSSQDAHL